MARYTEDYEDKFERVAKSFNLKKIVFAVAGILIVAIIGLNSYFTTDAGYNYVVQNKLTGSLTTYSEPGVHRAMPFFTNVYRYKQVATVGYEDADDHTQYTRVAPPVNVTFADTYEGTISATFRFRLPTDTDSMIRIHKEFRSFDNLVNALLMRNASNVVVVTATQYTGEEFFQGGLNKYKVQLEDQLRNGLYATERRQVEIEATDFAAVSQDNPDSDKLEVTRQLVWKNVIIPGPDGNPRRVSNPLQPYNIEVTQVTTPTRPVPNERLANLLRKKQELVAKRIEAEQQITTAQAEAKAAQQTLEIERRKAVQIAQKERDVAVIAQQREVEIERQRAERELVQQRKERDVAVIEREKVLAIAEANRNIEQANAEAAKFAAIAIREKGLAEAEVDRAKLAAKQAASDIYLAEIQRDIAKVMYPVLRDVKIDMPDFYYGASANGAAPNSLEVFTALGALEQIKRLDKSGPNTHVLPSK